MEADIASNLNNSATDLQVSWAAPLLQLDDVRVNDAAIKRWIENKSDDDSVVRTIEADETGNNTTEPRVVPSDLGIVQYPSQSRTANREIVLQEWEGQVQFISNEYFTASLVDLTAGNTEETEELELPVDDLSEGDRSLLVPGATFRWIIGYRYQDRQKERFTRVVIRRLPIWSEHEIKSADREAEELYNGLVRHSSQRTAEA